MDQQRPSPTDWNRLARDLGGGAEASRLLASLTTFRIGGPAGLVAPVTNADDARRFLDFAHRRGLPWTCLGGGSNILGDDDGYAGLVLLVRDRRLEIAGDRVHVGAGWDFDDLIAETLRQGLTGLEFASGIPGTLGGAVVGNAGCYGREIGEFVREATVLGPDGTVATVGPEAFGFAYRNSALKGSGHVVLDVTLALARSDLAAAADERADHLADRRRKHPWDVPCAGSYFKNLPPLNPGQRRRAAGILLEQVGAKAMHEGGAAVFPKHANIIINRGGATCRDVLALAARMKQAVRERFGEELEEEVRHLATPRATQDPAID
jgi:UDP-N-acetylmuramate dehydrogenase